jgi:hypothetical protein
MVLGVKLYRRVRNGDRSTPSDPIVEAYAARVFAMIENPERADKVTQDAMEVYLKKSPTKTIHIDTVTQNNPRLGEFSRLTREVELSRILNRIYPGWPRKDETHQCPIAHTVSDQRSPYFGYVIVLAPVIQDYMPFGQFWAFFFGMSRGPIGISFSVKPGWFPPKRVFEQMTGGIPYDDREEREKWRRTRHYPPPRGL